MINEEEVEAARLAQIQAAMEAEGIQTTDSMAEDYFGFAEDHKVMLPDGVSFIIHSTLNEGARRQYLNAQNRDITLEKVTGNAKVKVMQGEERHSLLSAAITDWSLVSKNTKTGDVLPVAFTKQKLADFLAKAPPHIIDLIEKDVRKHNPWLLGGATSDDIRAQIKDLEEMLEAKLEEEAGKAS